MTVGVPASLTRGGIVFRARGAHFFLPAEVALRVVPRPHITRVPGAPPGLLGIALSEGTILPVIELDMDLATMIVCMHGGEPLGLVGATDIVSGVFPASGADGVVAGGRVATALDLAEQYERVHGVSWGAGWVA